MTSAMLKTKPWAAVPGILSGLLFVHPAPASAQIVEYYHTDAIGNVRAITDASGNVIERHDYQPFGEEWLPQGGTQPLRFTGKERDAETGLDYFGARYYGSRIGRFTTVDPVYNWREDIAEPQRWNRYAYARNNPLRYIDPDGRRDGKTEFSFQQAERNATKAVGYVLNATTLGDVVEWAYSGSTDRSAFLLRAKDSLSPGEREAAVVGLSVALAFGARGGRAEGRLPNDALVVRSGVNQPESFTRGSGVTLDASGKLQGVSVRSAPGLSLRELSEGLPHKQVGCCTVGDVRAAGGEVTPSGTASNPHHATLSGVTPAAASGLLTPTVRNPNQ